MDNYQLQFVINLVRVEEPDGLFYKVYITDQEDKVTEQYDILSEDYRLSARYARKLYFDFRSRHPGVGIDSYIEAPFYGDAQSIAYTVGDFMLPDLSVDGFYKCLIDQFTQCALINEDINKVFRSVIVDNKLNLWQENQLYKAIVASGAIDD